MSWFSNFDVSQIRSSISSLEVPVSLKNWSKIRDHAQSGKGWLSKRTDGEPSAEKQSPEIRIVVAGKPGAGKSATGNTILGQKTFEAGTLTRSCQLGIGDWKGRRVVVLDTPAVFDIYSEAPRMSPEMQRALRLSRPGPHALLLVLYLRDFSDADRNAVGWIQEVFGREALKRTIVVFTGKDDLHGKTVDHYLSQGCYRHILEECGGRSCVFSNKEKGESQAEELRSMVEKMVQENQGEPLSIPETAKHPEVLPKEKLSVAVPGEQRDALPGAAEEKLGLEATGGSIPGEENGLAQAPMQNAESASVGLSSEEEPELRIVLVGRSGAGKSATGNTLLGAQRFESRLDCNPVTKTCKLGIREWKEKRLIVLDTPALFDFDGFQNSAEIRRCLHLSAPSPHALVLVTQVGRFTEEDHQAVERVRKIFGRDAPKSMIVLFTHREVLKWESLEDYISNSDNKRFQELIRTCSRRYCGFNNRETGKKQEDQAEELLSKIKMMVQENQDLSSKTESGRKEKGQEGNGDNVGQVIFESSIL